MPLKKQAQHTKALLIQMFKTTESKDRSESPGQNLQIIIRRAGERKTDYALIF
jgi:hypothetical protein